MVIICNKLKLFREVKLEHIGTLKSWAWKITFKIKQLPVFRSFSKTSGAFQNYSTSSDPHRDKLCCHIFKHLIWKLFLHIFWRSIRAFYLTFCSDILLWHIIWHPFWHPIWHPFWNLFWYFIWHSFWYPIWHLFWQSLWDLELADEVHQFPTEIWRSWLRSSSAHWDLELVVVQQGARSCNPRQEGGRRRKTEGRRKRTSQGEGSADKI